MGANNFNNEIKFVKKLLADFTVAFNQTRVAIITFSSQDRVIYVIAWSYTIILYHCTVIHITSWSYTITLLLCMGRNTLDALLELLNNA